MSDVSSIAATSTALSQARVAEQAEITTFKKGLDMQEANMLQLIATIGDPAGAANPSANPAERVGELINVSA